jgi:hypothetical protein
VVDKEEGHYDAQRRGREAVILRLSTHATEESGLPNQDGVAISRHKHNQDQEYSLACIEVGRAALSSAAPSSGVITVALSSRVIHPAREHRSPEIRVLIGGFAVRSRVAHVIPNTHSSRNPRITCSLPSPDLIRGINCAEARDTLPSTRTTISHVYQRVHPPGSRVCKLLPSISAVVWARADPSRHSTINPMIWCVCFAVGKRPCSRRLGSGSSSTVRSIT